jgi:putative transposase
MPRANRHFVSGQLWHITHRCHEREYLLKFARDRRAYLRWLFEAKKRFGLCVLNYMVTSNHVHLLIRDTGEDVIGRSIQLIAGCTAQDYNRRKRRQGAFWEDRYHATAIDADEHLQRCLVYIDLNMVRAGVVAHPREWDASGYREIQAPPARYAVIDVAALSALCGFRDVARFQDAHRRWVAQALLDGADARDPCWSEAIAVGRRSFVEKIQVELGHKAMYRDVSAAAGAYTLREPAISYTPIFEPENDVLRLKNTDFWERTPESTGT